MLDGRIDTQGTVKDLQDQGLLDTIKQDAAVDAQREELAVAEAKGDDDALETAEPENAGEDGKKKKPRKLIKDEHREVGGVKWSIYKTYLKAS
jgi:hypothetical protein